MGFFSRKAVKQPRGSRGGPSRWPCYYAEGVPVVDPATYRLRIDGLCEREVELDLRRFRSLPRVRQDRRMTCVTGWSIRGTWEGVLVEEVLRMAEPFPGATHLRQVSLGGYEDTIPLERAIRGGALLCDRFDGAPFDARRGGPIRLVVFDLWAYKGVKGIARIEATDRDAVGWWGQRGYAHAGEIEPGNDWAIDLGRKVRRRERGREVTEY